jgi:hypothetical protein
MINDVCMITVICMITDICIATEIRMIDTDTGIFLISSLI